MKKLGLILGIFVVLPLLSLFAIDGGPFSYGDRVNPGSYTAQGMGAGFVIVTNFSISPEGFLYGIETVYTTGEGSDDGGNAFIGRPNGHLGDELILGSSGIGANNQLFVGHNLDASISSFIFESEEDDDDQASGSVGATGDTDTTSSSGTATTIGELPRYTTIATAKVKNRDIGPLLSGEGKGTFTQFNLPGTNASSRRQKSYNLKFQKVSESIYNPTSLSANAAFSGLDILLSSHGDAGTETGTGDTGTDSDTTSDSSDEDTE